MKLAPENNETIILLDDADLHATITTLLASCDWAKQMELSVSSVASDGTGFTQSRRFLINEVYFNFLLIDPGNAHPFTYLTLGQRALRHTVSFILVVAQAHSLRADLYPGDLALVRKATALPYPALFASVDPSKPKLNEVEKYFPRSEVIDHYSNYFQKHTLPNIWQKEIPVVHCGYTKHPTWGGGLAPWADEQWEMVRAAGIETFAETPAGAYEAQAANPETAILCVNMIKSNFHITERAQWNKHKNRLLYPAVRLICDVINTCCRTGESSVPAIV